MLFILLSDFLLNGLLDLKYEMLRLWLMLFNWILDRKYGCAASVAVDHNYFGVAKIAQILRFNKVTLIDQDVCFLKCTVVSALVVVHWIDYYLLTIQG